MRVNFRNKGFTLIELMISVAIVAVLSAIAIPNFLRYQLKVKTAEARTLLGGIVTSEESFLAEFENYAPIPATPPAPAALGKTVWVIVPCPASCNKTSPNNCTSFECIGFQPPGVVYYRYATATRRAVGSTTPEYGVGAEADLDSDGVPGSFAYRSDNQGQGNGIIADPVSNCPANIESNIVERCSPTAF